MRYFVHGLILFWTGVAAAAAICFISSSEREFDHLRAFVAVLPIVAFFFWWVLSFKRAQESLTDLQDGNVGTLFILFGGVWFQPFVLTLQTIQNWSRGFDPLQSDSGNVESTLGVWISRALVALSATLITLCCLRSWSRGKRWMVTRFGWLIAFAWILYGCLTVATEVGLKRLGFPDQQARAFTSD